MSPTELLWIAVIGTTVLVAFIGFFVATVVFNQRRYLSLLNEKLQESNRASELLRQIPRRMLEAQEDERSRVARELHDGVNQMLASVKYRLHTAGARCADEGSSLVVSLDLLSKELERTMEEIKRISHNLRPEMLDDLGFEAAVRNLCDEFAERAQITMRCSVSPPSSTPLPRPIELGVFRIIQESLHNIEKYAGATEVSMEIQNGNGTLHLQVNDNGKGFDPGALDRDPSSSRRGMGFRTMRERAALLGGSIEFQSQPASGTSVSVSIPLS